MDHIRVALGRGTDRDDPGATARQLRRGVFRWFPCRLPSLRSRTGYARATREGSWKQFL